MIILPYKPAPPPTNIQNWVYCHQSKKFRTSGPSKRVGVASDEYKRWRAIADEFGETVASHIPRHQYFGNSVEAVRYIAMLLLDVRFAHYGWPTLCMIPSGDAKRLVCGQQTMDMLNVRLKGLSSSSSIDSLNKVFE